MDNDRPIIFTISGAYGGYKLTTKDSRGVDKNQMRIARATTLIQYMNIITAELNDEGYAVLFEVD